MAVPQGLGEFGQLGEFAELSTRNGLGPGYKVFARRDDIFAGRRTRIGRKVRPAVETAHRTRVLAQTKRSQFALWSRRSEPALWGSHTVFWQNFCLK